MPTIQIIEGARDIIGEVAGSKIGLPWSGQDDSYIESPYARNSIVDFYDNIAGCKSALYGAVDATSPNDKSLIYFCLNSGNATLKSQAQTVQSKMDAALNDIKAMKSPFALYYTDPSPRRLSTLWKSWTARWRHWALRSRPMPATRPWRHSAR